MNTMSNSRILTLEEEEKIIIQCRKITTRFSTLFPSMMVKVQSSRRKTSIELIKLMRVIQEKSNRLRILQQIKKRQNYRFLPYVANSVQISTVIKSTTTQILWLMIFCVEVRNLPMISANAHRSIQIIKMTNCFRLCQGYLYSVMVFQLCGLQPASAGVSCT